MSPEASFRAAMELCDLATLIEHDPVRDREIAEARRLWTKLKSHGRQGSRKLSAVEQGVRHPAPLGCKYERHLTQGLALSI
jgi:hypothetical protein